MMRKIRDLGGNKEFLPLHCSLFHKEIYRDDKTGIAVVRDGSTGINHSCHPNIDRTGSVRGMKKLGYWAKDDETVRCNGAIYNISRNIATDELDKIAREYCDCAACRAEKECA